MCIHRGWKMGITKSQSRTILLLIFCLWVYSKISTFFSSSAFHSVAIFFFLSRLILLYVVFSISPSIKVTNRATTTTYREGRKEAEKRLSKILFINIRHFGPSTIGTQNRIPLEIVSIVIRLFSTESLWSIDYGWMIDESEKTKRKKKMMCIFINVNWPLNQRFALFSNFC